MTSFAVSSSVSKIATCVCWLSGIQKAIVEAVVAVGIVPWDLKIGLQKNTLIQTITSLRGRAWTCGCRVFLVVKKEIFTVKSKTMRNDNNFGLFTYGFMFEEPSIRSGSAISYCLQVFLHHRYE